MNVSVITDVDNNCQLKWLHLQYFSIQQRKNDDKNIKFKCLLCKPKFEKLFTSTIHYTQT